MGVMFGYVIGTVASSGSICGQLRSFAHVTSSTNTLRSQKPLLQLKFTSTKRTTRLHNVRPESEPAERYVWRFFMLSGRSLGGVLLRHSWAIVVVRQVQLKYIY
jgi:hypothetical protein